MAVLGAPRDLDRAFQREFKQRQRLTEWGVAEFVRGHGPSCTAPPPTALWPNSASIIVGHNGPSKSCDPVKIPLDTIRIDCHWDDGSPTREPYLLMAFAAHAGGLAWGRYRAVARRAGCWRDFDDALASCLQAAPPSDKKCRFCGLFPQSARHAETPAAHNGSCAACGRL